MAGKASADRDREKIVQKHFTIFGLLLFFSMVSVQLWAGEEPLEKLIAKAEAGGDKKSELYVDVAQRFADRAGKEFTAGDSGKAQDDIKSVTSYAEKGRASVIHSEQRIKQTELKMHKLQRRLEEL